MPEIKCNVSVETIDRLFELKKREGKNHLTGNEFSIKASGVTNAMLAGSIANEKLSNFKKSGYIIMSY